MLQRFGRIGKVADMGPHASCGIATETLARSKLGRDPIVMRCPAAVVTVRCAIAAA
jgi:hypothetical protein